MPELIGKRLLLRDFRPDDWRAVHRYAQLPEVCRFVPWGPNTEQDSGDYVALSVELATATPRLAFNLAIEHGGQLIGGCNLHIVSQAPRQARIGYVLHPEYWRQGLATEAAGLLLALGFRELRLHRIEATCDPRNVASARVLQKAGMTLEGARRHDVLVRGQWRDSLLFAILEHEWPPTATSTSAP